MLSKSAKYDAKDYYIGLLLHHESLETINLKESIIKCLIRTIRQPRQNWPQEINNHQQFNVTTPQPQLISPYYNAKLYDTFCHNPTSPYNYNSQLAHFDNSKNYIYILIENIIDFALTIPLTSIYTSHDIFLSCLQLAIKLQDNNSQQLLEIITKLYPAHHVLALKQLTNVLHQQYLACLEPNL